MAGIAANTTTHALPILHEPLIKLNDKDFSIIKNKDLSPKLILKLNTSSEWTAVSHRSHRSHSSHRSHYSSSTGGSTRSSGTSSSSSSGISRGSSGSTSGSSINNLSTSRSLSQLKATSLKLGDRNLKRGMSGTDVTELINILLKKKYLQLEDGDNQVYGTYTYDETIEATIKRYQKNNNLTADGNCGPTTAYHLLNK